MAEDVPEEATDVADGEWLLVPDVPQGVRLQLSSVVEAAEVSPEVLTLLGRAMADLQAAPGLLPGRVTCPKLVKCGNYVGGCPRLADCENYSLKLA
jgi:hypothetical protein